MTADKPEKKPIRVLLLDDRQDNLILRSAILRSNGYEAISSASVEEAETHLDKIDIAVLDYHLGAGKFGTEVAAKLRQQRPQVPIIIMSATLERRFGGVEDMHLLKGHSSVDDLLAALRSFEARRRGSPVVVDARDFFYSRIAMAIGTDVLVQIFDADGRFIDQWLQFGRPSAIYIDKRTDTMYVSDSESRDGRTNTGRNFLQPTGYGFNPGVRRGIRIGSARDGKVTSFIPDPCDYPYAGISNMGEGVTADHSGNVYDAELSQRIRKFARR